MGWTQLATADGAAYYFNDDTQEVSWDAPPGFVSQGEDSEPWVWIFHADDAFIPARLGRTFVGGRVEAITQTGEVLEILKSDVHGEAGTSALLRQVPDDLVQLTHVSDAGVVHALRLRYLSDRIYTAIGDILVAVNPFRMLPLYTPLLMKQYMEVDARDLPPHVYGVAATAYHRLLDLGDHQAILISGESGAGKTESTKQCLQFLSEAAGSTTGVEQKILSSNPILESFGNAKTTRNNNSSRFGKFMELFFSTSGKIVGCDIVNYLLEKSRITHPGPNERSYHVFYQLCFAASEAASADGGAPAGRRKRRGGAGAGDAGTGDVEMPTLAGLGLGPAETFGCLSRGGCTSVPGVEDGQDYYDNIHGMHILGIGPTDRQQIAEACAAVMHLGNLEFADHSVQGAEGSIIQAGEASLAHAARLLGVSEAELSQRLRTRELTIRGETSHIQLNAHRAGDARDALASAIYRTLFDYLVARINRGMMELSGAGSLEDIRSGEHRIIGILDIFGFEIFEENSFEQLCINFCNEKLQQHFNAHTFKTEEETYKSEGVAFEPVPYIDNQDVLDLIEKRPHGILPMLDEEVRLPRTTDLTYLRKLNERFLHKHERFDQPRGEQGRTAFTVRHYAGPVAYCVENFLDKNKDQLSDDVDAMLRRCTNNFVSKILFAPEPGGEPTNGARGGKRDTQGGKFRKQLAELMTTLGASAPHYIRCVKPNSEKQARVYQGSICYLQLQCSGVFEAVSIRKSGYPFRMSHQQFFKRYRCLEPRRFPRATHDNYTTGCRDLIRELRAKPSLGALANIRVGKTMILWRQAEDRALAAARAVLCEKNARRIQRVAMCFYAKVLKRQLLAVRPRFREVLGTEDLAAVEAALKVSSEQHFLLREHYELEKLKRKILETERVKTELESLQHRTLDGVDDFFDDTVQLALDFGVQTPAAQKCIGMQQQVQDRRDAVKALRRVVDKDMVEIRELEEALAVAQGLKPKYGDAFCEAEEGDARELLTDLRHEQSLCKGISAALTEGCVATGGGDDGPSAIPAPLPSFEALEAAVAAGKGHDFRSPAGNAIVQLGEVTLDVRHRFHEIVDKCCKGLGNIADWLGLFALLDESEQSMELPDGAQEGGTAIGVDLEAIPLQIKGEAEAIRACADAYVDVKKKADAALRMDPITDDGAMLRAALGPVRAFHSVFTFRFCGAEQEAMETRVAQVEKEKEVVEALETVLKAGGLRGDAKQVQAAHVDAASVEAPLADATFERAWLPTTDNVLKVARYTFHVRRDLKNALEVAEAPKGDRNFEALEAAWGALEATLVQGSTVADLPLYDAEETEICKELVLKESAISDVVDKLHDAVAGANEEALAFALEQAERLMLDTHPTKAIKETVCHAQEFLTGLRRVKQALREAEGPKTDKYQVARAVSEAEAFGCDHIPGAEGTVEKLKQIQGLVELTCDRAHAVWQGVDHDEIVEVANQCAKLDIYTDDAVLVRELAALPYKRWLQRMLKLMRFLGRTEATTDITLLISDLFFETAGDMFELQNLPTLRTPESFGRASSLFGLEDQGVARGMLRWSDTVMPTSLTRLFVLGDQLLGPVEEREAVRTALAAFECILGYMGDRQYSYAPMLAKELARIATISPAFTDEVYVQMLKQLTGNPMQASFDRGLDLLGILVHTVAPSATLANYVESSLRKIQERRLVRLMHLTAVRVNAEASKVLTLEEIGKIAGTSIETGWLRLQKRGRAYDYWGAYWFVLDGVMLRWFKDDRSVDSVSKGVLDLRNMTNTVNRYLEDAPERSEYPFDLVIDGLSLTFSGKDAEDRSAWLTRVRAAKQAFFDAAVSQS